MIAKSKIGNEAKLDVNTSYDPASQPADSWLGYAKYASDLSLAAANSTKAAFAYKNATYPKDQYNTQ